VNSLFEHPGPDGSLFETLRLRDDPYAREAKTAVDALWGCFQRLADRDFPQEFRRHMHSRYWEMYLTATLGQRGKNLECPKPGPDILVHEDLRRIWIEAVAPSQGAEGSEDRVPDMPPINTNQYYPEEAIILRYRAAMSEKHQKYKKYLEEGIVSAGDACVIAINSSNIDTAFVGGTVPHIVQTVFPIGCLRLHLRGADFKVVGADHSYRATLRKVSGSRVDTDIFLNPDYSLLSAVLFSNRSVFGRPMQLGEEFILVHNPIAVNPLRFGWLGFGIEYTAKCGDGGVELTKTEYPELV